MKKQIRKGDILIICILIVATVAVAGAKRPEPPGHSHQLQETAKLTNFDTDETVMLNLMKDGQFDFNGSLGEVTVVVDDGKAKIKHSACPDQLCVDVFGWVEKPNDLSVCMPNHVMLSIEE